MSHFDAYLAEGFAASEKEKANVDPRFLVDGEFFKSSGKSSPFESLFGWKQRYYRLDKQAKALRYYSDADRTKVLGAYRIDSTSTITALPDNGKYKNVMELVGRHKGGTKNTLQFAVSTVDAKEILTNAITELIDAAKRELEEFSVVTGSEKMAGGDGGGNEDNMDTPVAHLCLREGNHFCSDCSAPHPRWVSINNLVLICTECSGIHRSLGVEYSFVQSLTLDSIPAETMDKLLHGHTTAEINDESLEFSVPEEIIKPCPETSREEKEVYIRRKYVDKAFFVSDEKTQMRPVSAARSAAAAAEHDKHASGVGAEDMVGIIQIVLRSARNLAKGGGLVSLKRSVRCELNLGRQKLRSQIKEGTDPRWDETIFLTWNGKSSLSLDVFDGDSDIGGVTVDLLKLKLADGVPQEILDIPLEDTSSGTITFEITLQKLGH